MLTEFRFKMLNREASSPKNKPSEIIEHLDNGLDIVEKLKSKCKRLLITVPYMEPKGFWGEHHKLHGLNESHFPDFNFKYCDENGNLHDSPIGKFNIMMGVYDKR